jgi:ABC-2 type transport system ATP-binding protein
MQPVIHLSSISKRFGHKQALNNVSIAVNQGEIFGFLGPNGAGKTTTIRCMMDFIRPDTGNISILNKVIANSPNIKQSIGYFAAENQLLEKWNAKQHIEFYRDVKHADKSAYKLLRTLNLDPNMPVKHMSTGNRQTLGFILALIGHPQVLILDEPTRGLDPLLQNEVYKILKAYVAGGGTVFISSHNLNEIEHLCTNVAVIKEGTIVADKSLSEIHSLKTYIVSVTFKNPKFKLPTTNNIHILSQDKQRLVIKIKGSVAPLLEDICQNEIIDIEVIHASLEDAFMELYK